MANKGKGRKSHGAIKPSASHGRSNDSESGEDKDNDVNEEEVEEEDEENANELWKEGRDDSNGNILRSLKKAVE